MKINSKVGNLSNIIKSYIRLYGYIIRKICQVKRQSSEKPSHLYQNLLIFSSANWLLEIFIMGKICQLILVFVCLAFSCSAQEVQENLGENTRYVTFSGVLVDFSTNADTIYLTLRGKKGELKDLWSILSDGITGKQYMKTVSSELTDDDPTESHEIFHAGYLEVNDTNYLLFLAGQLGDVRYSTRLLEFKPYNSY